MSHEMETGNNERINNSERIGRLEASLEGFQSNVKNELNEIRGSLREIIRTMSKSKETNWGVVLAGVAVAGSLYASAIRPLNADLERQQRDAATLAQAVIDRGEAIAKLQNDLVKTAAELGVLQSQFRDVYEKGSPITDKRLALIELQLHSDQTTKPKRRP